MRADWRAIDESTLQDTLMVTAPSLRNYVASKVPSKLQSVISAEDVLQEVWITAFRGLPRFRPDGPNSLDRWLTRIAGRKLIKAIKAATGPRRGGCGPILHDDGKRVSSMLGLFARLASPGRTPSSEAAAAEAVDAVQIALESLPDARRRAIRMRYIEGKGCDEIALAMAKSRPAVNSLLYNGLRQLHQRLGSAAKFLSDAPTSEDALGE